MSVRKKILLSVAAIPFVAAILFFSLRNYVLHKKIESAGKKFTERTGGQLLISERGFSGLASVQLSGISVVSPTNDTLIKIASVEAALSLKKLMRLRIFFSRLSVDTVDMVIKKTDSTSNYSFLLQSKKSKAAPETNTGRNYASAIHTMLQRIFDVANSKVVFTDFKCHVYRNLSSELLLIPKLESKNGNFTAQLIDEASSFRNSWTLKGNAADDETALNFSLEKSPANSRIYFPFFDEEKKLNAGFSKLNISISGIAFKDDMLKFNLQSELDSLTVNHWRIADEPVLIKKFKCNYNLIVSKNRFEAATNSWFQFNDIRFDVLSYFEKSSSKKLAFTLDFQMPSQDFFNSLPASVFPLFEGIKTTGHLNYSLQFVMDDAQLDSLVFNSSFRKEKFSIRKFGKEYFPKINQSFLFDAYDRERFVKSFWVGTENPDFTPLNEISTPLQYAVLTSEDPSFFHHNGFVEEAFRESIITNLKEKRFVRGGSTISMQIVKNVFLSREKNIARKLQEILITWFMESNNLVSKERLFEIYLNVIEWGPGIYGIKEASKFYFNKKPAELNLAESIYLSSIIPHPKYFKYSFDKEGKLKPYLSGYYRLIASRMIFRTWITPFDTIGLKPEVTLHGDALKFILPADTIPADTIPPEDDILN